MSWMAVMRLSFRGGLPLADVFGELEVIQTWGGLQCCMYTLFFEELN